MRRTGEDRRVLMSRLEEKEQQGQALEEEWKETVMQYVGLHSRAFEDDDEEKEHEDAQEDGTTKASKNDEKDEMIYEKEEENDEPFF